jgi:hypothetical protein
LLYSTNCALGRDLSQCKHAFELQTRPLIQLHTPQPYPQTFLNPAPVFPGSSGKHQSVSMPSGPDTKKRKSGAETPTLSRDLLPKPVISSSRQMPTPTSPPETRQKKRGRPSKTDVERKQREAIERGDVIPPISVPSPPAGLQGQDDRPGVTPVMILPAPSARNPQHFVTPGYVLSPEMGVEHGPNPTMGGDAESSGKKRKPRPPPNPDNK